MRALVASLAFAAACGKPQAPPPHDTGPCWPLSSTPGGTAELGTGDTSFMPMPATLFIVANGSQSDPFLEIYSRITGIPPGNPVDALDPKNPHTKVSAIIPDLGLTLGVPCPASIGYMAAPVAGAYDLEHSLRIGFGTAQTAQMAVGHQATITLDVVGSNGVGAHDEKTVVLGSTGSAVDAGVDAM